MAEESHRTPREEPTLERADRDFGELLQELRIIQTGVQTLFALLLTLAFTTRFPTLDTAQRAMYITTLPLAVLATALSTTLAGLHRTLLQRGARNRADLLQARRGGHEYPDAGPHRLGTARRRRGARSRM